MNRIALLSVIAPLFCAPALAQQTLNVRGVISGFEGTTLDIKSNDGRDLRLVVPETLNVNATKAFATTDIKTGMTLGVTTIKRADGATVAIDVRPIPATASLGLSDHDLQLGSTMTNAAIEGAVSSSNGQELTLNYKSGVVKVLVLPETTMSQSTPGSRAELKSGETVFVAARRDGDQLTAVRLQVSRGGVKPTQ